LSRFSLFHRIRDALACPGIEQKLGLVGALAQDCREGNLIILREDSGPPERRGTPPGMATVRPAHLPRRRTDTGSGLAALFHSVAHIEYTAIDLALDHACRFPTFPDAYYRAWIEVAAEEARHFALVRERLRHYGHDYGDFPVHKGLWEMAQKTADDALARMALVPRLMEARGLDATPPMQEKLKRAGDLEGVRILGVILYDEVGHVALGDRWFRWLCRERGLTVETTFRDLIETYRAPWPSAPMNEEARLAAGFTGEELAGLMRRTR